jgi:hypothetical protein
MVKTTAISERGTMLPTSLDQAITVAKMIAHSGMVPKQYEGNTGGVLIAIQMGAELGLSPMSAIQNIAVVNGRPSLWGDAMLALVLSHPHCDDVIEQDTETIRAEKAATCIVKRRGKTPVERTFSMADAEKAGLLKKDGVWQTYPYRMLQMRARGFALRDAFPDALRGVHLAEEARDLPSETVVLTPEWREINEPEKPKPPKEEPKETKTNRTKEALKTRKSNGKKKPEPKKEETKPEPGKYDEIGPPALTDEQVAEMEAEAGEAGF